MDRRQFLKAAGLTSAAALLDPFDLLVPNAWAAPANFGLHPSIEARPEAVFIKRTNVPTKTDTEAKMQEGLALAREIFVLQDSPGIPLSHRIVVKPNLTCNHNANYTTESSMGIITDPNFVEGMLEGMKELGLKGDQFHLIEVNCPGHWSICGYTQMADRVGAHLRNLDRPVSQLREGDDITWVDCPDGVVFKRIAYLAPVNQPETWLLNIAKFKTHGMGLTLCAKNQQGMAAQTYVNFCATVSGIKGYPNAIQQDFQPDFEARVQQLYTQHVTQEVPRWDRPEPRGGHWMETWSQRTCDSLAVTDTGFCIIEGIYGRDGDGFHRGPGPNGDARDYMTNVLIFGKDKFRVDMIGHWLAGHEPGNFGFFHIAQERGLSDALDPRGIPLYLWEDGTPAPAQLEDFERTPLETYYLQHDYAGGSEPWMHLVNEPYAYPAASVANERRTRPTLWGTLKTQLYQNYPNPFNPETWIPYQLSRDTDVTFFIYTVNGALVRTIALGQKRAGVYTDPTDAIHWDGRNQLGEVVPSGVYFYHLRTGDGYQETRRMLVAK